MPAEDQLYMLIFISLIWEYFNISCLRPTYYQTNFPFLLLAVNNFWYQAFAEWNKKQNSGFEEWLLIVNYCSLCHKSSGDIMP